MVELRRDVEFEGPVVTGFTALGFKVGARRFDGGLLLSPEQAVPWSARTQEDLDLDAILTQLNLSPAPEFLLLGSGPTMQQPPAGFRRIADAAQIGLEVMDSRAAARAWGVLRAEERWVIAALLPFS